MKNVFIKVAYDGTDFHGWQRQPDSRTVQGELEKALSEVCGEEIQIDGTSRTDAGVHAYGQCATFQGNFEIPVYRIAVAVNNYLAGNKNRETGDIRVISAKEVPFDFHARFNAKGKKYIYRILCGMEPDVFRKNYYYQIRQSLDIEAMREAASFIVGTHDFKCFQSSGGEEKETTVRTVDSLEILEVERGASQTLLGENQGGKELAIEISGDGFLYNMVRIITGTLVEVGLGKRPAPNLRYTIASLDRANAGFTAPPQGLYLKEVYY